MDCAQAGKAALASSKASANRGLDRRFGWFRFVARLPFWYGVAHKALR